MGPMGDLCIEEYDCLREVQRKFNLTDGKTKPSFKVQKKKEDSEIIFYGTS